MNLLIDEVPTTVIIDDVEFEINSDFRISMMFELLINDPELSERERLYQALILYYPIIPSNLEAAVDKIMWFYKCGKEEQEENNNTNKSSGKKTVKKIYDYEHDSEIIFASFMKSYNINLQRDNLHWWEFKSLFDNIDEDSKLYKIMEIRSVNLNQIKDKDKKNYYKKMKDLYKLPDNISKSEKEKLDELGRMLLVGEDITSLL